MLHPRSGRERCVGVGGLSIVFCELLSGSSCQTWICHLFRAAVPPELQLKAFLIHFNNQFGLFDQFRSFWLCVNVSAENQRIRNLKPGPMG